MGKNGKMFSGITVHKIASACLMLLCILMITDSVPGEIIRLHDGQVINGKIIERSTNSITVQTKYQKRRVRRSNIKKIEEEHHGLARLYILTRDNRIISGYLVEQDSRQVVYRTSENSPVNRTISKLDILRMSNEEIRPVDLEFCMKPGVFIPLNSGGSELGPAFGIMMSIGFSSMVVRNLRILLESGYTRAENDTTPERYLQVLPITLSAAYRFAVSRRFEITPRIGAGSALIQYNDGEVDEISGSVFACIAGLKLSYALIPRRFYIGVFADYLLLMDTSGMLHNVITGFIIGYRI